jgi:adenylosuccinate synthase
LDGLELDDLPALDSELQRVEPVYIELEGWNEQICSARKWYELPPAARLYLGTLAEIVRCPISVVSVGAEREATVFSSSAGFIRKFMGE